MFVGSSNELGALESGLLAAAIGAVPPVLVGGAATLAVVGAIEPLAPENNQERVMHRKSVAGSLIGSIAETRAVLEFCAEHGIAPDVQVIPIGEINHAYKMVEKGEVRFRYVIDMASLEAERAA